MAGLVEVKLRRMDTSQPWGFRMRGGAQQGIPLIVENVRKGVKCEGFVSLSSLRMLITDDLFIIL